MSKIDNDSRMGGGEIGSGIFGLRSLESIRSYENAHYSKGIFPLVQNYPLVEFKHLLLAQVVYAVIVLWGWTRMNANKKPLLGDFAGRYILRVYNAIQVVLSAYITYLTAITYGRKVMQGYVCQAMVVDINSNRDELELETFACWLFYISKWVDYMDTIFIVSRSKWRQFSFLHLYHHSSMIALTWAATHYHPCGYFLIAAQLNAPVHFVMYFYYLLSSFPSLTRYLWWKNYITSLQLIQFVTGIVVTTCCVYRQVTAVITGLSVYFCTAFILYGFSLFYLFFQFYQDTYKSRKTKPKPKKDE